jgi:O-antigen/teichoic acid export membrane protein
MESLKSKTISSVLWSFLERFGTYLVLLITQIVLARLLLPADFGLIGMLTIFIAISQAFIDSGFDNALIQKKHTNQKDYSTVFYFNILIGFLCYGILFFSAPLIAEFFEQEKLVGLTRLVGLILVFNALGLIQLVKFKKELNFKVIAQVSVTANFLSAVIGIGLALMDYGVWALAFQMVSIYFLRSAFYWMKSHWRPSLVFSKQSFRQLFGFGSKLLISGIIDQIFQNIYLLVIGKLFTAKELGYYTQAQKFQEVPVVTLASVVGNVTFPAFSKIQDDDERLRIGFRKMIKLLVFVNFPMMLGLAVIAQPLFLLLLGEKWLPAVPYFQILCISGMIYTLHTSNLSILKVKGRSDLFLYLEIIKKVIVVLAILIGLNWGIMGLVVGQVVTSFISLFLNAFFTGKLISYSIKAQLKDVSSTLIIALLMVGCMILVGNPEGSVLYLLLQILTGISAYFLLAFTTKQEAMNDSLLILKELIPLKRWKNAKS